MRADLILDEAIAYVAEDWSRFDATLPSNLHLRDKVTFFSQQVTPVLVAKFPDLRAATEQVLLLVLAKGLSNPGAFHAAASNATSVSCCLDENGRRTNRCTAPNSGIPVLRRGRTLRVFRRSASSGSGRA